MSKIKWMYNCTDPYELKECEDERVAFDATSLRDAETSMCPKCIRILASGLSRCMTTFVAILHGMRATDDDEAQLESERLYYAFAITIRNSLLRKMVFISVDRFDNCAKNVYLRPPLNEQGLKKRQLKRCRKSVTLYHTKF